MPFIIAWVFRMMAWKLTVIIHYLLSSYATRLLLKADFYLQLNAEPQRPSSKEDGSRNAHNTKKCPPGWAMIDDNHVCFCPLLQWKKPFEVFLSIFVICCQECCKKHSDVEETKTTIFQNLLNFQKQVILRKNVNFGRPEIGV